MLLSHRSTELDGDKNLGFLSIMYAIGSWSSGNGMLSSVTLAAFGPRSRLILMPFTPYT